MTVIINDPAEFADDAIRGFVDAFADIVMQVPGGVVRATTTPPGKVAVIVGGGSGHYPAFAGLVGHGFADGAVVGNVFTSPSTADVESVVRNVVSDAGAVVLTGNYAGDVMNFTLAAQALAADGIDARYLVVTDDLASAPPEDQHLRRGVAGDFTVFKIAGAAAQAGRTLDEVEAVARLANDRTRTLGVAFTGCTLPGGTEPLFTVPAGRMGIGVGIHGEPGIGEIDMPTAAELAEILVTRVTDEAPVSGPSRAAVVLNGLGRTSTEELFVLWSEIAPRLRDRGVTIVAPEIGELVTSLDMAGCSLTLTWLDEDLEALWLAPAATPAFRRGEAVAAPRSGPARRVVDSGHAQARTATPTSEHSLHLASQVVAALDLAADTIQSVEAELGRLDAVAGDGDHGRGMVRGVTAARDAAHAALARREGADEVLRQAGLAWGKHAGGTSGVLWGAMLAAAAGVLRDDESLRSRWSDDATGQAAEALDAAIAAMQQLGKASPGDKTMLDALVPLRDALRSAAARGDDLSSAWRSAAAAAMSAAEATASLVPKVGRARPLAQQSVGTPDPGAISLATIAQALTALPSTGKEEPHE